MDYTFIKAGGKQKYEGKYIKFCKSAIKIYPQGESRLQIYNDIINWIKK